MPRQPGDELCAEHAAAGPETSAQDGCAAASSTLATPPEERITSGSGSPASPHAAASLSRYAETAGPR